MAKEVVIFDSIERGMIGNEDSAKLPAGSLAYCENLDPQQEVGTLCGMYDHTSFGGAGIAGDLHVVFDDGSRAAELDGTAIYELTSMWKSTPARGAALETGLVLGNVQSGVGAGHTARLGLGSSASTSLPRWIGIINHNQFNNAVVASGITESLEATLRHASGGVDETWPPGLGSMVTISAALGTTATAGQDDTFTQHTSYFWFATLIYDGFQEGPLWSTKYMDRVAVGATAYQDMSVTVTVDETHAQWSNRITHIVIYRGLAASSSAEKPDTEPQHVITIDINDDNWGGATTAYTFTFSDEADPGATYSNRTGVSPTLPDMELRYGLTAISDQYLFVADCLRLGANNLYSTNALYKSRPYRWDQFDLDNDFRVFPEKIYGLHVFANKVFAFGRDRTFVVDPETLALLDQYEGVGIVGQKSAVSTGTGLFWADRRNIYIHDGQNYATVGEPVLNNRHSDIGGYLARDTAQEPIALYDAQYGMFLLAFLDQDTPTAHINLLGYQSIRTETIDLPVNGRWWFFTTDLTSMTDGIKNIDGSAVLASGGAFTKLFRATTRRAWEAVLPALLTEEKCKYYQIFVHNTILQGVPGAPYVSWLGGQQTFSGLNKASGSWIVPGTPDENEGVYIYDIDPGGVPPPPARHKRFQMQISSPGEDNGVTQVGIHRRRMVME